MYNKKYKLENIEEFNGHNYIYDEIEEGAICYPAYFNVGERGWFLYIENRSWHEFAHRIHTSVIDSVDYLDDDNTIIVTTQNTRFTFRLINN